MASKSLPDALKSVSDSTGRPDQNGDSTPTPGSPSRQNHPESSSPKVAIPSQDKERDPFFRSSPPINSTFENRLRPAQDVVNRIIWDDRFDSNDYLAVYEDRFEGRLEVNLGSWKKDLTDEEFIPLHRIVYVVRKADGEIMWDRRKRLDKETSNVVFDRHVQLSIMHQTTTTGRLTYASSFLVYEGFARMNFSRWRKRNLSSSSGSPPSSPAPELQSPSTYNMSINKSAQSTIKQKNKPEKVPVMPPMFCEDVDEDEVVPCNLTQHSPTEPKLIHEMQAAGNEEDVFQGNTITRRFKDAFCTREPLNWQMTKTGQDSIVVFEIQMNIGVRGVRFEEPRVISTLSPCLAEIYQRSEQSVMVTIQQDACILFGSSLSPAYLMKVFAPPSLIAPITNRRNTVLLQSVLQEVLHIQPDRGIIVYVPIPGENLATNGTTFMDESPISERTSRDDGSSILKNLSRSVSRRLKPSNSRSTAPSEATTCSWEGSRRAAGEDAHGGEPSNAEENPPALRRNRSVRHFVSRRLSELGSLGDVQ